ncbi:MAG: flavodoxin family protein [Candidatus Adiutrix sp.]
MDILALHLSPRKNGNSAVMLREFVKGASSTGAQVTSFAISDHNIKPCIGCAACEKTGNCIIRDDDMKDLYPLLISAPSVVVASSVFFYDIPAAGKALIDRAQPLWARRYLLKDTSLLRPGKNFLLALGATRGQDLFVPTELCIKYFFDAIGFPRTVDSLFFREIDAFGEFEKDDDKMRQAYEAGVAFAKSRLLSSAQGCSE